jgi:hypothetical protein
MLDKLITRVRGVLLQPRRELPRTIAEPGDVRSVLIPYVLVLVSVGALAQFISHGLIGVYVPPQMLLGMRYGGGFLRSPLPSLIASLLYVGLGCGAWWLFAFLLVKLAPSFGARPDRNAARKAAAYIATPIWLAGALALLQSIPYLGIVSLAGHVAALAYAVFIGMQALPILMGTPESKAVNHTLAALAITTVGYVVALVAVTLVVMAGRVG